MYLNSFNSSYKLKKFWLTLTWDVFKFGGVCRYKCTLRLTLTWDVFKFNSATRKTW